MHAPPACRLGVSLETLPRVLDLCPSPTSASLEASADKACAGAGAMPHALELERRPMRSSDAPCAGAMPHALERCLMRSSDAPCARATPHAHRKHAA
eukprot:359205-Chlamydomonas_euryale.AAC.3